MAAAAPVLPVTSETIKEVIPLLVTRLGHHSETKDRVRLQRAELKRQDVKALHARAETIEQRAEALQASLRAAQMDIHVPSTTSRILKSHGIKSMW
ncbi:hypothetical protein Tco_0968091 [Tanacetum coccineum]